MSDITPQPSSDEGEAIAQFIFDRESEYAAHPEMYDVILATGVGTMNANQITRALIAAGFRLTPTPTGDEPCGPFCEAHDHGEDEPEPDCRYAPPTEPTEATVERVARAIDPSESDMELAMQYARAAIAAMGGAK